MSFTTLTEWQPAYGVRCFDVDKWRGPRQLGRESPASQGQEGIAQGGLDHPNRPAAHVGATGRSAPAAVGMYQVDNIVGL
jgi:hypothetical protein